MISRRIKPYYSMEDKKRCFSNYFESTENLYYVFYNLGRKDKRKAPLIPYNDRILGFEFFRMFILH